MDYTITQNVEDNEEYVEGRFESYRGYKIKASDPYGFFSITPPSGPLPAELKGNYTTIVAARKKIEHYLNTRTINNQNKINNAHREKLGLAPVASKEA